MLKKITLLGVSITNATESEILEYFSRSLQKEKEKFYLVTPNPEILVYATKHPKYKQILNQAHIALPDGIGIFLAGLLLGQPFKQRLPGVDFIEMVCKYSREKPISIGFLGGRRGVAERTAQCLLKKYPWIRVRWVGEEWENDETRAIKKGYDIQRSGSNNSYSPHISKLDPIDILFVAFGFPKQEEWIYSNLDNLPVKSAMGVGGAFDYISGDIIRAPYIIRAMGLEWLFRLVRQPWRLKRQLALLEFLFLIIKERITKKNKRKNVS